MKYLKNFIHATIGFIIACISLLLVLYVSIPHDANYILISGASRYTLEYIVHNIFHRFQPQCEKKFPYNSTYPLTPPVLTPDGIRYKIAIVSDLDKKSLDVNEKKTWISYFKIGYLTVNVSRKLVSVEWKNDITELKTSLSDAGRGMELSELIVFDGKLLAMDDRTGIIFEITECSAIPYAILPDGDGKSTKGFKSEWATVKDQTLIIGGFGKEWISGKTGEIEHYKYQWIKMMKSRGKIIHENWKENYLNIRKAANITFPGYMIHEAVAWSQWHKEWIFLPRKSSTQRYNEHDDETNGINLLIRANEDFTKFHLSEVGPLISTRGFSSFKFIPGTSDTIILALKTEEVNECLSTFITAFTLSGDIWLPETKIDNHKYEGIEFI